jgi:hypothetical protein
MRREHNALGGNRFAIPKRMSPLAYLTWSELAGGRRALVFAALVGLLAGAVLIYAAAETVDALTGHQLEDEFLAVYDCEATGSSFAQCTRSGGGARLRWMKPPPESARSPSSRAAAG